MTGRLVRSTCRAVTWMVVVAALGLLACAVVVPRLGGAVPYAVLTGSMSPGLPPGTLVVVRPVEETELAAGDVVTYQLESGRAAVVTHRVVEVLHRADGGLRLRTRGDANPAPDTDLVLPDQVRGELWYAVPWLGRVHRLVGADAREAAVLLVALGLGGYALLMFAGAWRDRRDRVRG